MSAYYKAMYDYEGTSETELSFKAEEILEITHADGDWWYGRGLAGEGYIAPAFLDTTAEVAPPGLAAAPAAQPAAAPEPALPTQTPEEMRKNRAILLDQIIESEANFVQALEYFSATIFDSLSLRDDNFKRSFLADPSLGLCCSLLAEQLKFICSNFLESVRTARGSNDVRKLAAAFEQFAPSLQVFAQYTSENTNALNHLKSFGKALEDFIEAHPMPPGYSLESFFLLPVQHYTGYLRGFQQYVLLTPESDDGADVAQEALDLVAGFSLEVDEKLKLENERIILLAIQSKFVGNPPIYKPSRRFVKDGRVERLGEGKKPKVYHLHLFNDAILISSYNSVFDSFKFHKVVDLADGTVTAEVAFEVVTGFTVTTARMQRYTFRASNPEEAAEWMRTIGEQIAEIKAQADKMAAEAASGDKKPSKYSKRASMVRGPVGGGAPIATSLQQALAQANVPAMGARAKVLYLFLKQESDFCTQLQKLDNIVIQSLIAASKGAPLKVGAKESDAYNAEGTLFQQSNSTLSVIGGTFARMQAQAITDLLKQSGVQIYLRAAESLCGSIEQILDEMEIRASAKLWAETLEVGDVFTSLAATALCQQHEQYASCELESLRVIKSSNMSNFVKEAEAQLVPFTIDKLMGTPVNGPERYLKFFQELLAATPASHPDHAGLTASVAVLERTVNAVTDVMRVKRNYEKLIDIQSSFVTVMFPDPVLQNLVSSKRTYIQEGDLYKVCRKKNKKFRFFLFNDLLAYGASIGPGSYSWNRAIDLSTCQIKKLDNSVHQNAFEVLGDEKSFVVICGSPSELESWTTNIQNQMDALGNFAGSSKAVVAAVWVPDALGTNGCCVCNCEFTMFKRKHHCRKCGKIVCGDHSKNSIVLPISKKNEKLRVCDTCFKNKDLPDAVAPTSPAAPAAPAAPAQVAAAAPPVPAAAPEVAAPPPVPSMPAPPPAAETAYAPPVPSMVPVPVPAREEGPPAGMAPPPPPPPASTMMTAPSADSGFKPPPPPPPGRRRSLTQSTGEVVGLADAMSQGSSRSLVAPPPPPPPRAGGGAPPPPPPPPAATSAPAAPAMERPRMDLMSAIKSGSTGLKKVEVNAPKPPPPPDTSNLLGMLAVAMNDRRVAFTAESDDDSDASGFSDDD